MDTTKLAEGMHQLNQLCKGKDWFYDIDVDKFGNLIVYVRRLSEEILRFVPDTVAGFPVLVHFFSSKTVKPNDFSSAPAPRSVPPPRLPPVVDVSAEAEYLGQDEDDMEELPSSYLVSDISTLARELDRLERICGSNILQDIFYEIHDGKNAVTNLSAKFPEVAKSLSALYDEYGFDIIYEEMDG